MTPGLALTIMLMSQSFCHAPVRVAEESWADVGSATWHHYECPKGCHVYWPGPRLTRRGEITEPLCKAGDAKTWDRDYHPTMDDVRKEE